ncbi:MAG: hypothetical protein IPQ07_28850 [Myxococcales bacterium]|nr:hypothetical protein [Myxococcales bacterium]
MLWRTGEQILVKRNGTFVLIAPSGEIAASFTSRSDSYEDDLWEWTHQVVGDQLVARTTIQHGGDDERLYKQEIAVDGLRAVDDAATRQFADAALAAADAARDAQQQADERAGEARVAAIPGGLDDLGLGEELTRAQRALCQRIRGGEDARAAALLRTLVKLARVRPSAAAIGAYARGCLCACYQNARELPATAEPATPNPELAREIEAHAKELDEEAEGQMAVDANQNAAAMWSAAAALRVAARMLE